MGTHKQKQKCHLHCAQVSRSIEKLIHSLSQPLQLQCALTRISSTATLLPSACNDNSPSSNNSNPPPTRQPRHNKRRNGPPTLLQTGEIITLTKSFPVPLHPFTFDLSHFYVCFSLHISLALLSKPLSILFKWGLKRSLLSLHVGVLLNEQTCVSMRLQRQRAETYRAAGILLQQFF